jgi:hypothetical protein
MAATDRDKTVQLSDKNQSCPGFAQALAISKTWSIRSMFVDNNFMPQLFHARSIFWVRSLVLDSEKKSQI